MTDQIRKAIRSTQVFMVVSLFTLCAVMAACDAQEASRPIEPMHSPDASPISGLGFGTMTSAPEEANPIATSQLPLATGIGLNSNPSPQPSSTQQTSPGLPEICQPYPSAIGIWGDELGNPIMHAACAGERFEFPSLIGSVHIFDYAPLTGRLAYSRSLQRPPGQPPDRAGDLWIYDFQTGKSTKWLGGDVVSAIWSPDYDSVMEKQFLAVMKIDGTLALGTGPNSFSEFANVDDVCKFSLSPFGDQIAYLSDCHEISEYPLIYKGTSYIMNIHEGQPRKMAEDTIGIPIWALDHRALIIPGSPIRVYKLDESKSIPLAFRNGEFINGEHMLNYNWSPSNRLLYMDEDGSRHTWFAELSEDLSKATNFVPGYCGPLCSGNGANCRGNCVAYFASPQGQITHLGKILSLEPQSMRMSFVLTDYYEGFGDAEVIIDEETLFLDAQGNRTDFAALEEGMYIDFLGKSLSPDTLTLIATRVQIIGPTSMEVIYQAQLDGISPYHPYEQISVTSPEYKSVYSIYRDLYITSETQVFDIQGNRITIQDLQLWMIVEIVGSSLPSDPQSIVASRITILEE
jgi:hypothetical protein